MKAAIQQLIDDLQRGYDGDPWHGRSLLAILDGIDHMRAAAEPRVGVHSIAQLVLHIASWKEIVAERLTSTTSVDVAPERDWPLANVSSEADWKAILKRLELAQRNLLREISGFNPALLPDQIPGKRHSFATELFGVAQHDAYHAGQIAILKQSSESAESA